MEVWNLSHGKLQELEDIFAEHVKMKSRAIEKLHGKESQAVVKLEFVDKPSFNIISRSGDGKICRGIIEFPRLQLMALYQMFFQMNCNGIFDEGKNEEVLRWNMFYTATCCILQHELAHIYRGHLELLSGWRAEPGQHLLDIRTLEWDADFFITGLLEERGAVWKENYADTASDLDVRMLCATLHGVMFWQRKQDDLEHPEEEKEQTLLCREISIIKHMKAFQERLPEVFSYILEYEKEFGTLFKNNKTIEPEDMETRGFPVLREVEERWRQIKEQLKPLAVIPLEKWI